MGADAARVVALTAVRGKAGERPFGLAADLPALEMAILDRRPALVIIDPLSSYLGGQVDAWRDNEVRSILGPLAALAERHSVAMDGVAHLTKGRRDHAIYRGQGSIAFAAAARSILLVGESPETPGLRVVVQIKGNLAPRGPSLGFSLDGGRFAWTGEVDIDADALLAPDAPYGEHATQADAEGLLREVLAGGPVAVRHIEAEARAAGLSWRTVERAKATLGIRASRAQEGFGGGKGYWTWALPAQDRQLPYIENVAALCGPEAEKGQGQASVGGLVGDAEEVLL
jgi:hypothetical protein